MPSFVAFQGGAQTATLFFDGPIVAIAPVDVTFAPDPGVTSVALSADSRSALVTFTTPATPGNTYTVTVAAGVSVPPLTGTTVTAPLVFGSDAAVVEAENAKFVNVPAVYQGTSAACPPAGAPPAPLTFYLMRAYNTVLVTYVWWTSSGSPDFAGTSSGYPPGDLTDIVLETELCN